MIQVFSKAYPTRVYAALSLVTSLHPEVHVKASQELVLDPETKAAFVLGSDFLAPLGAIGVLPKKRTTTSMRGQIFPWQTKPTMVSYAADIGDMDHGLKVDLLVDTAAVIRLYKTGTLKPTLGTYRWVNDFTEIIEGIKARYEQTQKPVKMSFDLEWFGSDPWAKAKVGQPPAYVISIQVAYEYGKADCVYFSGPQDFAQRIQEPLLRSQLDWLLNSPIISTRGSNLKSDLQWLVVQCAINCTNFRFDTVLVGGLLDENRTNGLNLHTKIYVPELGGYDDEFNQKHDKSRMDLVPKDELLPYAGGDADATLRVADKVQIELLKDPQLSRFYVTIMHPASRAFEKIERGGVFVSHERYAALAADLDMEMHSVIGDAKKLMGGRIVAKHYDSDKTGGLNLSKPALLCDFMFSPMGLNLKPKMYTPKPDKDGNKKPSTAIDHIMMFEDVPEAKVFVGLIKRYGQAAKARGTYVGEETGTGEDGFRSCLRGDRMFHPTYFLFAGDKQHDEGGTSTGRTSCKWPAFQTIPKFHPWAKRLRECFIAPPGYVIMERDFSQGELRIAACIANESNMIAAYKAGRDLHVQTAAFGGHMTYEDMVLLDKTDHEKYELLRQRAKAGNFGLLFGMGVDGFIVYAKDSYGVTLTYDEAEDFRNKFFGSYPNLLVYHKEYKAFARKNGFVRCPMGRVRHLPLIHSPIQSISSKAERQAINAPVQGTLSDMMIWSFALEDAAGLTDVAPNFGNIHDAGYNYVLEDKQDEMAKAHLEIMENLPFQLVGWRPQLQFKADAKFGPSMGELKAWKGVH